MLAVDHEGHAFAKWFNQQGVHAFVLKYRLGQDGYRHPSMLGDAQRAIRTVRANAEQWRVDPERLGILGFSAGGHLASTAGTHFDSGRPDATDPVERMSSRPTFMILGYPVISLETEFTHRDSRSNLLGEDPQLDLVHSLSNETQVTSMTPPTFLVHTNQDAGVPAENSVLFYLALRRAGVPAEMHIYEKGQHGLGMAPDDPVFSTWMGRLRDWLKIRGVIESE
jgi:acetyl esterase/lipase